jgi:glutamate-1-semialdehyde aminotransferase
MSWMDDLWDHPPMWVAEGRGAHFTDVDGHDYLDMHIADASAFCGHAPEPLVRAVRQQIERGNQFQLPGEDAIWVAEHLARRYGLPKWQFTLSATQANTEVIRLARVATGRDLILVFDGKYHGHLEETMVVLEEGRVEAEMLGLPPWASGQARVIQFNDVSALEAALARRDVALVLTEPALTNAGIIRPESDFHKALRDLTRVTGTLLAIDETHTLVSAYGGLTGEWGLEPDFLTLGKSLAAGVPLAAYGMTEALSDLIAPPEMAWEATGHAVLEVATGGTLFANALSMAAGKAVLGEVLTEQAFGRTTRLGGSGGRRHRGGRRRGEPPLDRRPAVRPFVLHLRSAALEERRRVPGGRDSGAPGAHARLPGESRDLGGRLVARTCGLGRPYGRGCRSVPQRLPRAGRGDLVTGPRAVGPRSAELQLRYERRPRPDAELHVGVREVSFHGADR